MLTLHISDASLIPKGWKWRPSNVFGVRKSRVIYSPLNGEVSFATSGQNLYGSSDGRRDTPQPTRQPGHAAEIFSSHCRGSLGCDCGCSSWGASFRAFSSHKPTRFVNNPRISYTMIVCLMLFTDFPVLGLELLDVLQ